MGAPGHTDIVAYEGSDGAPANDTDPIIGAITGTVIATDALDKVVNYPPFDSSPQTYYGGFYYKNNATGTLDNARIANRTAVLVNPIVGAITFGVGGSGDEGKLVFVWGTVSAVITSEYVVLPASGFVSTVYLYDDGSVQFYEVVNDSYQSVIPSEVITISQSGTPLGQIFGTAGNPAGKDLATSQAYSFLQVALATAVDATIGAANRLTPPTTIGAFGQGLRISGQDEALPVPSNQLTTTQRIGVAVEVVMPGNFPTPAAGYLQLMLVAVGNALP